MNIEPQDVECRMLNSNFYGGHFDILHSVLDILRFKTGFVKLITSVLIEQVPVHSNSEADCGWRYRPR